MNAPPNFGFDFELDALEHVPGWMAAAGAGPAITWTSLSSGAFSIDLGDLRLLEPSAERLAAHPPSIAAHARGDDYLVGRYWEDLLVLLPHALEPVPDDLARLVCDPERSACCTERIFERYARGHEHEHDELEFLLEWWHARQLHLGHLRGAPVITWMRTLDQVEVAWCFPEPRVGGAPVWSAPAEGRRWLDPEALLRAARAFDRAFVGEMGRRVQHASESAPHDDRRIDRAALRREQERRATWLEGRLARRLPTDWDAVRAAWDRWHAQIGLPAR